MRILSVIVFGVFVMAAGLAHAQSMINCTCYARDGSLSECLAANDSCAAYCEETIGFSVLKIKQTKEQCGSSACPATSIACLRQQDDSNVTWPKFAVDFDGKIEGTSIIDAHADKVETKETRSFCSPSFNGGAKEVVQSSVTWDWEVDKHERHYCKGIGSCGTESFPARRMKVLKYAYLKDGSNAKVCLIVLNSWSTKKSAFHLRLWLRGK